MVGDRSKQLNKLHRGGVILPTALFLTLVLFTLATVTLARTAHDLKFSHLASQRMARYHLARAAVATALARLNSGLGNEVDDFDSSLEGEPPLVFTDLYQGTRMQVRVHQVNGSLETLRFEGRAFPDGSPGAYESYNVTIVKQLKNEPILAAKTPEALGVISSIYFRSESTGTLGGDSRGEWQELPPARAYDYDGAGQPVPARRLWQIGISDMPAWLLTAPAFDQTGKFYAQFQNVRSVLSGRNVIYRYDITAPETSSDAISDNWKVLPPIPLTEPADFAPLAHAAILGNTSVDGQGRVLVSRHKLNEHSLWRFEAGAEPGPGELVVPGDWTEIPPPPLPGVTTPMLLTPVADDEGNVFALWGSEPGPLILDLLRDLSPDEQSGELELGTVEGINTVYRLPAEGSGGDDWMPLPPIPNLYYDENGLVQEDGVAEHIGGLTVSQAGEVYAQVVRDGPDSMLRFAGGRWQLLPRAAARRPEGEPEEDGHYADFNNFTLDSRLRLYGKDPNFERGVLGFDTLYRYKGGNYDTESPVVTPPLDYRLNRVGGERTRRIHQLAGGGLVTDRGRYQFVPVASY